MPYWSASPLLFQLASPYSCIIAGTAREYAMADQTSERDPRAKAREARAQQYFEQDLKGQRSWYSERGSTYKQRTQLLALLVIGAGAVTSFMQVFSPRPWVPMITAA